MSGVSISMHSAQGLIMCIKRNKSKGNKRSHQMQAAALPSADIEAVMQMDRILILREKHFSRVGHILCQASRNDFNIFFYFHVFLFCLLTRCNYIHDKKIAQENSFYKMVK